MRRHNLLIASALATGACSSSMSPSPISGTAAVETACSTAVAKISFDFEVASSSRCVIEGAREFSILVTPEHQPPINPSPWYAFRYKADGSDNLTVHLRYLGARHRYAPKWHDGTTSAELSAEVNEDRSVATLRLPPGEAIVSAQEVFDTGDHDEALTRWERIPGAQRVTLGYSHSGRAVEALRLGQPDAAGLVVLLGRQHPPEVTGAIAMEAFVDRIAELVATDPALGQRYQFLVIPLLNPDGVAHGNWRANLGGRDLNRDWGEFSQPETQAVKRWLDGLAPDIRPVLMLDFHSTYANLFYVQGDEATPRQVEFLNAWLTAKENAFADYPFTVERRNANPGSGTTKNWFHETYGIPAYTYEVADDADRDAIRKAAKDFASSIPKALEIFEK